MIEMFFLFWGSRLNVGMYNFTTKSAIFSIASNVGFLFEVLCGYTFDFLYSSLILVRKNVSLESKIERLLFVIDFL